MKIRFTKMHGLGNDFVVLDAIHQPFVPTRQQARFLADRHFGIGCDQILVVEKPGRPDADFRYRIFNADGGEVEQCGNGARCFARFVTDKGLTDRREIPVETKSGLIVLRIEDDGQVTVDMGAPRFAPADIPFDSPMGKASDAVVQPLDMGEAVIDITAVSMGNPHAVHLVADVDHTPVEILGPLIESHPRFPQRTNAGFMQVVDRHAIRLRVYERGAGETLACGTGACAAAVAGIRRGLLDSPVRVITRGGELTIAWAGMGAPVLMTGPAVSVFEGEVEIPENPQ
ncbi:MAG: diaminopimelate epimerase [Candidatus Nitricoxidivorans perseverans]|uniref:Diaminopimelate epimerase n=1 Tax=Candidatus Nitricoxidivorans perseverans TaxID=2975601 RepID=A0AA49IYB0_9PROT|nr:MAG: diaminopimelate epimerase [Candidatus Nitricoxidivorans perseverans]